MDLVVTNYLSPAKIFKNITTLDNRWVKIRLKGRSSNRFGIGSSVTVTMGDKSYRKLVSCGSQYLSQEDTTLTFGLGKEEYIDSIQINWPGYADQFVEGPFKSNQLLDIHQEGNVTQHTLN